MRWVWDGLVPRGFGRAVRGRSLGTESQKSVGEVCASGAFEIVRPPRADTDPSLPPPAVVAWEPNTPVEPLPDPSDVAVAAPTRRPPPRPDPPRPARRTLVFPSLLAVTPSPDAPVVAAPARADERPSDRPTAPRVADPPSTPRAAWLEDVASTSCVVPAPASTPSAGIVTLDSADVMRGSKVSLPELSASLLESERDVEPVVAASPTGGAPLPPWLVRLVVGQQVLARVAFVALAVACVVSWRAPRPASPRAARVVRDDRLPMTAAAGAAIVSRAAPVACGPAGHAQALGSVALAAGVSADVVEGDLALGFVTADGRATAMRVDARTARPVETVRAPAPSRARRVLAVPRADVDGEADAGRIEPLAEAPSRFVVTSPQDTPRELFHQGAWIGLRAAGASRLLWMLPSGPHASDASAAFTRVAGATRVGGDTFVAVRAPSMIWLGQVSRDGQARGPLEPLSRAHARLGAPSVAVGSDGAYVAWAEREGSGPWAVMIARFGDGGEASMRRLAPGMSPALGVLAGGDLLVGWSAGPAGAHRIEAVRLSPELEPRSEPFVVSDEGDNAGQPAVAIRRDGAGVVAYVVAKRGGGYAAPVSFALRAAPVVCRVPGG